MLWGGDYAPPVMKRLLPAPAAASLLGLGLVHLQSPSLEVLIIESADGFAGSFFHLHESEASGRSGFPVGDQGHRGHGAVLGEDLTNTLFGGREGQVTYIDFLRHTFLLRRVT